MTLVHWREWNDTAFAEAREFDKPIVLDIGAVWCHWCHVMDHGIPGDPVHTGTYNDQQVAELINSHFVAIKVDTDRRPDINARYNMGGWPTTAFLTPNGDMLYGETYVPPGRMIGLLNYVKDYYAGHRDEIIVAATSTAGAADMVAATEAERHLSLDIAQRTASSIKAMYDRTYGGFGTQPKFPHAPALLFCVEEFAASRDAELQIVAENTLSAMASGGMYDQYAGGYFRYSTTRDWSVPHYEKMLEDNACLARVGFRAARLFGKSEFADVAREVLAWLTAVMRDNETGTFAGSQDADKEEEYYGQPLDARSTMPTPFIDRTVYVGWNALAASAFVEGYRYDRDLAVLAAAQTCFQNVFDTVYPSHYRTETGTGGVAHLLTDVGPLLAAALDLFEVTGNAQYRQSAALIADDLLKFLDDVDAQCFRDMPADLNAIGALSQPKHDINDNALAATGLLRWDALIQHGAYRRAALRSLQTFAPNAERYGIHGSAYASAVRAALSPELHVVVVGEPYSTDVTKLMDEVYTEAPPLCALEIRAADNSGDFPPSSDGTPLAYVCFGTSCLPPVNNAEDLAQAIRRG